MLEHLDKAPLWKDKELTLEGLFFLMTQELHGIYTVISSPDLTHPKICPHIIIIIWLTIGILVRSLSKHSDTGSILSWLLLLSSWYMKRALLISG